MHRGTPFEVAIQTSIFTRAGCERVMRFAFELARKRNKKKRVTSITKSNAQKYSMVFWDEVFREVAADYPDIETNANLVDAAAMNFIRRPEMFDVVVASNLFADILTDLGAVIMGGMALLPAPTSILSAPTPPCLNQYTARLRTSKARALRIPWPPSGPGR